MATGKSDKKKSDASGAHQPAVKKAATKKTGRGKDISKQPSQAATAALASTAAAAPKEAPAPAPKCVMILRGLPGSGKSTRAEQLAAAARAAGYSAVIHSTDSFFTDPRTGQYRFSFRMLHHNHERNFDAFCSSLQDGVHTVIVDNTNIKWKHYERYEEEAHEHGYDVKVKVVGKFTHDAAALYAARNVHGVPYEKVMQMLEQWLDSEEDDEDCSYAGCSEDEIDGDGSDSGDY